ncbi:MAG: CoA ester lyase [Thermoproteota archaeon]|jgi:citrate lyase subunit beta/citryl-CoA lyase|nr:CoA ester lyase [Thermoproteota archaeon]
MKIYRCLLFTPANDQKKIIKLKEIRVDAVILDLEDSVPIQEKEKGRKNVLELMNTIKGNKAIGVRINSFESKMWLKDILQIVEANPDFIMIPKVKNEKEIEVISKTLKSLNSQIPLIASIEDGEGLSRVFKIAKSCDEIIALMFGKIDFNASIGGEEGNFAEMLARALVSIAASTNNLQAIDSPCIDLKDLKKLEEEARIAKSMGYTGKTAIHPSQIEIINKIFTPSKSEYENALKIIEVYEKAKRENLGAIRFEDKMIDEAVVKHAKRIVGLYENVMKLQEN